MDFNIYFHSDIPCTFEDQKPSSYLENGSFSQWKNHINGDSNSIIENPLISDYGYLTMGSPAIERGTCNGAPADDINSNIRPSGLGCDMGADEFWKNEHFSVTKFCYIFKRIIY